MMRNRRLRGRPGATLVVACLILVLSPTGATDATTQALEQDPATQLAIQDELVRRTISKLESDIKLIQLVGVEELKLLIFEMQMERRLFGLQALLLYDARGALDDLLAGERLAKDVREGGEQARNEISALLPLPPEAETIALDASWQSVGLSEERLTWLSIPVEPGKEASLEAGECAFSVLFLDAESMRAIGAGYETLPEGGSVLVPAVDGETAFAALAPLSCDQQAQLRLRSRERPIAIALGEFPSDAAPVDFDVFYRSSEGSGTFSAKRDFGYEIEVTTANAASEFDLDVLLDGTYISHNVERGAQTLSFAAPADVEYVFNLSFFGDPVESFDFRVRELGPRETLPAELATLVAPPYPQLESGRRYAAFPEEEPVFARFEATRGKTYRVTVSSPDSYSDMSLAVVEAELENPPADGTTFRGSTTIDWECPADGVYAVRVEGISWMSRVDFFVEESDLILLTADGPPTQVEPGTRYRVSIGEGSGRAVHFAARPGSYYEIFTENLSPGTDTILELFRSGGLELLADNDDGGDDRASRLWWYAGEAEELEVRVVEYSGVSGVCDLMIREVGARDELGERAPFDGFAPGDVVILGRHTPVEGDENWLPEMRKHVDKRARITKLDRQEWPGGPFVVRVDVDDGRYEWRTRDLGRPES